MQLTNISSLLLLTVHGEFAIHACFIKVVRLKTSLSMSHWYDQSCGFRTPILPSGFHIWVYQRALNGMIYSNIPNN